MWYLIRFAETGTTLGHTTGATETETESLTTGTIVGSTSGQTSAIEQTTEGSYLICFVMTFYFRLNLIKLCFSNDHHVYLIIYIVSYSYGYLKNIQIFMYGLT